MRGTLAAIFIDSRGKLRTWALLPRFANEEKTLAARTLYNPFAQPNGDGHSFVRTGLGSSLDGTKGCCCSR